jgi:hypothetical protein
LLDADLASRLTPEAAIARKAQIGGTAGETVRQRLKEIEKKGKSG